MKRAILACILVLTVSMVMTGTSWASDSVKMISSSPAGGNAGDFLARKVADLYKQRTGKEMPVLNVTGGNHIPAVLAFKKESLAVIFGTSTMLIYNPALIENLPYQANDFNVLRDIGLASHIIFTHKDSGINSLEDLVKGAKPINIGVSAMDGLANVNAWKKNRNPNIQPVNFKSYNEVVLNVVGQHIAVGVIPFASDLVFDYADKKDVRILGHSGDAMMTKRNYSMRPAGVVLNSPSFFGGNFLAISPGDSAEHKKLRDELAEIFKDPEIQDIINKNFPVKAQGKNDLESLRQRAKNNRDLLVIK